MEFFLDLETTGITSEDKICSVGLLYDGALHYELINEGKKIPPQASSIHNITNEMIKDAPLFSSSKSIKILQTLAEKNGVLVAHNSSFDITLLAQSGFIWEGEVIDTLRITKHLIPDLEKYSLNFLRYELKLYKKEQEYAKKYNFYDPLIPHHAASDVIILQLLYEELALLAPKEKFIQLSNTPVLLQKFEFGKYAGRYIEEISMCDRGYLEWMLSNIDDLDEDMRYTLEYYL